MGCTKAAGLTLSLFLLAILTFAAITHIGAHRRSILLDAFMDESVHGMAQGQMPVLSPNIEGNDADRIEAAIAQDPQVRKCEWIYIDDMFGLFLFRIKAGNGEVYQCTVEAIGSGCISPEFGFLEFRKRSSPSDENQGGSTGP